MSELPRGCSREQRAQWGRSVGAAWRQLSAAEQAAHRAGERAANRSQEEPDHREVVSDKLRRRLFGLASMDSPLDVDVFAGAIRKILDAPENQQTWGFSSYAAQLREKLNKRIFVLDKGDALGAQRSHC